jgi:alkanesulfonate monooxygenase SsuD/methylene tetrahydromethanopterin reductase-like flavin-dependent oxidoreductase (luciferase family)
LPAFQVSSTPAERALQAAEAAGIHGCFCYDHLWPLGSPGRPALAPFPLLASLASRSRTVMLGTLVARVGLVPDAVLEAEVRTLVALSGDRFIAGLGTGDSKSAPENRAYGVPFAPSAERRARLEAIARKLQGEGVTIWVGGGSPETNALAVELGAVLNVWAASPERVAELARHGEVSWGGTLPREEGTASALLAGLAEAGATWAIVGWPGSVEPLVEAARAAGIALGGEGGRVQA